MGQSIKSHHQLDVFKKAFSVSMELYALSKAFPIEERYSLTDQLRRSSRSVAANLAEAWRKRRCEAAFISKLSDSEAEAAETQVWIEYAVECGYLKKEVARPMYKAYEQIIRTLVGMINHPETWIIAQRE